LKSSVRVRQSIRETRGTRSHPAREPLPPSSPGGVLPGEIKASGGIARAKYEGRQLVYLCDSLVITLAAIFRNTRGCFPDTLGLLSIRTRVKNPAAREDSAGFSFRLPRTVLLFLFLESAGKFDLALTSEIEAGSREQQFAAFLCGQLLACSAFSLFNPVDTFVLPARQQGKIDYTWFVFFAANIRGGKACTRCHEAALTPAMQRKITHSGKILCRNAVRRYKRLDVGVISLAVILYKI